MTYTRPAAASLLAYAMRCLGVSWEARRLRVDEGGVVLCWAWDEAAGLTGEVTGVGRSS